MQGKGEKDSQAENHGKEEFEGLSFKEGEKRLEAIVSKLEQEDLDLEEAIAAYEEGVKLYRYLSSLLEKAERKIEILSSVEGSEASWRAFERAQEAQSESSREQEEDSECEKS